MDEADGKKSGIWKDGLKFSSVEAKPTDSDKKDFEELAALLASIPCVKPGFGVGREEGFWWFKFQIDIQHPLAWSVVQALGNLLNYLSLNERLPTEFKPVSPSPELNGGPREFLSWVIECFDPSWSPKKIAEFLDERLPYPIDDPDEWENDQEWEDDEEASDD